MMWKNGVALLLICASSCSESGSEQLKEDNDQRNHFVVYFQDGNIEAPRLGPQLILGAWADGKIVWSSDRLYGGPPYKTATVDKQTIVALLRRLKTGGFFAFENDGITAPGSSITVIEASLGDLRTSLRSCHEVIEALGLAVTEEIGNVPLDGRYLHDVICNQSESHVRFRLIWLDARLAAAHLCPCNGREVVGKLAVDDAQTRWLEGPAQPK